MSLILGPILLFAGVVVLLVVLGVARWAVRRVQASVVPPVDEQAEPCLRCGYDLRGTRWAGRTRCPECGRPMDSVATD